MDLLGLIGVGVAAFVATNIDDIFVLMMFFSTLTFPPRQVVFGQYLGIGALVGLSAVGALIALLLPQYVIGLMGIVPIAVGILKLIDSRKANIIPKDALDDKKTGLAFLSVAGVTFANGGDNIGVYTPLFAKYNTSAEVVTLAVVYMAMTAVWCAAACHLVNHPLIAAKVSRVAHVVLPFVLIGLGIYILADAFLIS
jgi:cadmium resistance protein CadD (predicted permease)